MTRHWAQRKQPEIFKWRPRAGQATIRDAVESLIRRFDDQITEKRLVVELDVDVAAQAMSPQRMPDPALESLLALVISRTPSGGNILITAVETPRGVEIEFADSGADIPYSLQGSRLTAFQPTVINDSKIAVNRNTVPDVAGGRTQVICARCPQGGLAWTLVQRQPESVRKVA